MKVLKFGGTSVGSVKNMDNVKSIINDGSKKIVVLSAMSGTTNALVSIAQSIADGLPIEAIGKIKTLHETYIKTIDELLNNDTLNKETKAYVASIFDVLNHLLNYWIMKL